MSVRRQIKDDEQGFALVITMLFSMIALAFTGALLFMTIQGTKISAIGQRYATALDAGKAMSDVAMNFLISYPDTATPDYGNLQLTACMDDKLTKTTFDLAGTYQWSNCSGSWTDCASASQTNVTSASAKVCPDITGALGNYTVWIKVVDTKMATIASVDYYYYSVEIYAEKTTNPQENAQISFLYRVY